MLSVKEINIEVKFAVIFAFLGLLLSLLIGMLFVDKMAVVFTRALLMSSVFGAIGFGSIFVIKKFVPEIYEALSGKNDSVGELAGDDQAGMSEMTSDANSQDYSGDASGIDYNKNESFDPGLTSFESKQMDSSSGPSLGKHILEAKGFKFEPKLMAQAIRTMMSKDE